jgi:hypothetical protein
MFWLVVSNMFYFSIYWEQSSQLTKMFQSDWNHQPVFVHPHIWWFEAMFTPSIPEDSGALQHVAAIFDIFEPCFCKVTEVQNGTHIATPHYNCPRYFTTVKAGLGIWIHVLSCVLKICLTVVSIYFPSLYKFAVPHCDWFLWRTPILRHSPAPWREQGQVMSSEPRRNRKPAQVEAAVSTPVFWAGAGRLGAKIWI